jgi:hypothetical protein
VGEDEDVQSNSKRRTVIGSAKALVHQYIFSSRDGSERAVNTQSANTLVQLIAQIMSVPAMTQAPGFLEKLFSLFNEVFRMSGAGVDLYFELAEGQSGSLGQNEIEQIKQAVDQTGQMLQQLAQQTQKNATDIAGQTKVNEEQQQAIDLSAQMAQQVQKLAQQVQDIIASRDRKVELPEIPYRDAPWSVQSQMELQNGFVPAKENERIKLNGNGKSKPA